VVLAVLPALYKILKEFTRMVAYRKRWINVLCQENELGWLSVREAPGFAGVGERKLKKMMSDIGLSRKDTAIARNGTQKRTEPPRSTQGANGEPNSAEKAKLEIDIRDLFSIGYCLVA
jgi:calcium permeable stress-gated cation channel